MGCNCIPNGTVKVSGISNHADLQAQTQMQEEHLQIISSQLCKWAPPTYGDAGESWEKLLWQAALIAVATINTLAQIQIMEKRYKIAKDYANLAQDRWERFKNNYAPLERAMLSEAGNMSEYTPNYPEARARAMDYNGVVFRSADEQLADLAQKYSLCIDTSFVDDMDYAETISLNDSTNFNYRDEENWAHYVNDKRWNRRSQLLNLGRDLQSLSATYADAANRALTEVGGLLDSGAQGAMRLLGYLNTARETQYPSLFSSAHPLTGQASGFGSAIISGPAAQA